MRRFPEETDQISFSPISRYSRGRTERFRVGPRARSQVRSHANSHRPGKFSCPEVQLFQPSVKILHIRVVKSRYGLRGVRVGEATHPCPPTQYDEPVVEVVAMDADDTDSIPDIEEDVVDALERDFVSESCRTRLRLTWNDQGEHIYTREDRRRVGAVPRGGQLPRVLRQQRWSPLNVPLMWAAAGQRATIPVLDWLIKASHRVTDPVEFHGGSEVANAAVRIGWNALRETMRSWGITDSEGLSNWLTVRGFPRSPPGSRIAAKAQELILHEASATDARVSLLETVYVLLTIQFGREGVVPEVMDVVALRPQVRTNSEICAESWERLDEVDLDALFLQKIPMLKTCPRFLRGRLRHCFGVALRERHRAKLAGDRVVEIRAWKLFGMVPIMLLRRTKHSGIVGRDELDRFSPRGTAVRPPFRKHRMCR